MQYRRFGRTNLPMPIFSCGGMWCHYTWQDTPRSKIPKDNQKNLEATLCRALEVGITHIETARAYGTSELQLGQVFPKLPRDRLIVQTKVSPKPDPEIFRQNLEISLQNLQLDMIDLLAIHGINTQELIDQTLRPGGCLDIAHQYQKQGRICFIGFATHGPTDIITQAIETGEFDYVNLHWYYINQTNWPAIEAAQSQDMGVFIISPSDKGGQLYKPPQKLVDLCAPLSPMLFNDLFCLSHPQLHTLSLGAARPSDFDEHLKVLPLLDRADEVLPPILSRLEEAAIATLGETWYKTWHVGLPTPEQTPNQINIPTILWLRNLALAYDLVDYAKRRYNLLGNGSHWFPGNKGNNLNVDLAPCLANSPHADIIPDLLQETDQLLGGQEVKRLSQS
ncbi:MAG: aldo/keto reductase [Roseofilum sp. SBFL]|uniref:aldo/keto reductase n=1 Tax=unclassified Roseofilum TaxID=2620099 RepID=UPI001B2B521B|nr:MULTISPECIES: aldo/keto reductase [unclassified Roseofilum]MBP0011711.1 aldo/keto reductase [Roseofilum sp. SID3]MBP0023997.1 aldo/keto reductase [Roseofilum sp. SID2]MBP0039104.1 aldo/keto reductase [Roseofilum sp. SID1]MBP0044521.1 aldo/keto reductase [Roseofilum sp. SBFL]